MRADAVVATFDGADVFKTHIAAAPVNVETVVPDVRNRQVAHGDIFAITAQRHAVGAFGRANRFQFLSGREADVKRFFVFNVSPFVFLQIRSGFESRARAFGIARHAINGAVHHEVIATQH